MEKQKKARWYWFACLILASYLLGAYSVCPCQKTMLASIQLGGNACVNTEPVLLQAIEYVESSGDCNAIGDGGAAVGCLQIHKIMVDDVNRILGADRFTYADRYHRGKSYAMARIYFGHYCKGKNDEYKARCWNGGPTGWKKKSTEKYWHKIQDYFRED